MEVEEYTTGKEDAKVLAMQRKDSVPCLKAQLNCAIPVWPCSTDKRQMLPNI